MNENKNTKINLIKNLNLNLIIIRKIIVIITKSITKISMTIIIENII
jgi:hypothetical protein